MFPFGDSGTVSIDKCYGEGIKLAQVAIIEAFPSLRLSGKPGHLPSQEKQALDKEIRGNKSFECSEAVSQTPQLRGDLGPAGLGWVRDLVVLMQGQDRHRVNER